MGVDLEETVSKIQTWVFSCGKCDQNSAQENPPTIFERESFVCFFFEGS